MDDGSVVSLKQFWLRWLFAVMHLNIVVVAVINTMNLKTAQRCGCRKICDYFAVVIVGILPTINFLLRKF